LTFTDGNTARGAASILCRPAGALILLLTLTHVFRRGLNNDAPVALVVTGYQIIVIANLMNNAGKVVP